MTSYLEKEDLEKDTNEQGPTIATPKLQTSNQGNTLQPIATSSSLVNQEDGKCLASENQRNSMKVENTNHRLR